MNLDLRSKFRLFLSYLYRVYRVAGLVLARKIYVHCEVEVHTVYQRLFYKADKGLRPMQHIPSYFACLSLFCIGYKLEGFGVKAEFIQSTVQCFF